MEEDAYKQGQVAFYHETGEVDKVEVLENNSDKEWIRYKLKILEVVRENNIVYPSDIGEIFTFEKKRDSSGFSGLGHLLARV